MEWKQVLGSSNVAEIKYEEGEQECWVKFLTGDIYIYEGVTPEEWAELESSPSKGRYVQIALRRSKTCRKFYSAKKPVDKEEKV